MWLDIFRKKTPEKSVETSDVASEKPEDLLKTLKDMINLKEDVKENQPNIDSDKDVADKSIESWLDKKQKKVYERLKSFEKYLPIAKKYVNITDGTVPLETIVWLIPGIWDGSMWAVNAAVMWYFGRKLQMGVGFQVKNVAMQTVDTWVGVIPVVGDVIDAFFKSNRRMYRSFLRSYDWLIKKAEKLNLPSDMLSKAKEHYASNKLERVSMAKRKTAKEAIASVLSGKAA